MRNTDCCEILNTRDKDNPDIGVYSHMFEENISSITFSHKNNNTLCALYTIVLKVEIKDSFIAGGDG